MSCRVMNEGGVAVVSLAGEVDLSGASEIRRTLLEQLAAGRPTFVRLREVSYIDSSGIASLVEAYQAAKKKGLRFGLLEVSEPVMNVLALARLDKVFPIHANLPTAS